MFEHKLEPLISRIAFLKRFLRYFLLTFVMVMFSLGIGILGYHTFENLSWLDALLNASMILGGMGPVGELHTDAGKLFASFYALFSGLMFVSFSGLLFAPFMHRMLHAFHLEQDDRERE